MDKRNILKLIQCYRFLSGTMKNSFLVGVCRVVMLSACCVSAPYAADSKPPDSALTTSILVESFNLRYDNPEDGVNAWPKRRDLVLKHLVQNAPDVVGMQEVLAHQFDWLKLHLADYAFIGVGRDDGKRAGEFAPLIYNKRHLTRLDDGYFWLSDTPNVAGSIGWLAHLPRIVTWAKLRKNNQVFFVFNVHFSHVSDLARKKSAEFLVNYIPTIAGDKPVILIGDFNTLESDPAYFTLISDAKLGFQDTALAHKHKPSGTFNGFGEVAPLNRIDYIFISHTLSSDGYKTHKIVDGERYISDHYPISVNVEFPHLHN